MEVQPPASKPEPDKCPPEPLEQIDGESRSRYWERNRRHARAAGLGKQEAYTWATTVTDAIWKAPITPAPTNDANPTTTPHSGQSGRRNDGGEQGGDAAFPSGGGDESGGGSDVDPRARSSDSDAMVIGLGDLPESWPKLPPNAPLAAEIQWVQANRLQCVTEIGERCVVDLSRSLTPAPSYSALGWLETSIRAYTKFVDVAAKATATLEDEKEHVRREKMAIDDIRKLLAEMVDG